VTGVLDTVIALASTRSGLPIERLSRDTAIYQDLGMFGDDVEAFIADLARAYGEDVLSWPWARFTNLNEPNLWTAVVALVQLPIRMLKHRPAHSAKYERLELGHIAAVIESGQWHEP
jgi:hypothetical protein